MTQSRSVSYAALLLAALALVVSSVAVVGGIAEAAGKKIGKNLVVTKSIKNGAVTGKKVKDGSLTTSRPRPRHHPGSRHREVGRAGRVQLPLSAGPT